MQWMFSAMQLFMAKETIAKMKWMSYGSELHKDLGSSVGSVYGGSGPELGVAGQTPKYDNVGSSATTAEAQQATATETAAPAPASLPAVQESIPATTSEAAAPVPAPVVAGPSTAPEIKVL